MKYTYKVMQGRDVADGTEFLPFVNEAACKESIQYIRKGDPHPEWRFQKRGAPIKGMSVTVQPADGAWCVVRVKSKVQK